MGVTCSAFRWK